MESRKQVTFLERDSDCQGLQQSCLKRTRGHNFPKTHDSNDATEIFQEVISRKVNPPIPSPANTNSVVQTAIPECFNQQRQGQSSQQEECNLMPTFTSDHCLIQKEPPGQQELRIRTAKQEGKQTNTYAESKVRVRGRKIWQTEKDHQDADLPVNLAMLEDGLTNLGEVKENLQHTFKEMQVSFQIEVKLLQGVIESSTSQIESAVEEVSSTVNSVETTLQSMDSRLVKINSNLLQLQETVEFGFKELTKEIASLVKWLCQNLSAGRVEHQAIKPLIRTIKAGPI
ncbi:protein FAM216A isoform X1 [Chiloscyllium plagiosum]|uniref:protein FAM216A isoform X1 n=1 Tax=Chiloscyllium plagiosum TaxID=36176 RepID=UPI001CB827F5|nr:protein FAM216A isoform X1 [Chiloscyllium plagiosum]